MSPPISFSADFQLPIERARIRGNDIAAQDTEPLTCLNQFFVRKRSDKFAIIVFAEFTEPDWAGHRDAHGWSAEEGENFLA
jgi:hypothetical protein